MAGVVIGAGPGLRQLAFQRASQWVRPRWSDPALVMVATYRGAVLSEADLAGGPCRADAPSAAVLRCAGW
jgi:hypothetical protein